ncbi:DUF4279 domain-containing protein [Streptomyces sp. A3M-1-3]|uniref:DUF4279 domain-containing protein n=1 Tax=Streptomyces sp. A3M-1-3 TaxID=2962044 RepID=UPI0035AB8EF3
MQPWKLTDVSLVVKGRDLDPDRISERLGLMPTSVRPPGPSRWEPAGETDGRWRLQCDEHTSRSFADQLDNLLGVVEEKQDRLAALAGDGFEVFISVHGFATNDSNLLFTHGQLLRMSRLHIPLTLIPNLNDR